MPRDALTILCPAKVNLALSVGPPRPEDGRHPICSWMVAVGFGDTLRLTRLARAESSYEIRNAEDAPSPQQIDWPLKSDLAFRAHGLMRQHTGEDLPVNLELTKRIPAGAGLGGGSGDAAAVLVALNSLFSLRLSEDELIPLGFRLGSDVGFLVASLHGKPSAVVLGVGERVEPVALNQPIHMVLILPPIRCATNEVYHRFDEATTSPAIDEARVRKLAGGSSLADDGPFNDLADPAFLVAPELRGLFKRVRSALDRPVHVSGSGSAMFVVAPTAGTAKEWADKVTAQTGLPAIATRTLPGQSSG